MLNKLKLSNDTYDLLKYIALVALPALASLYFGLSKVWGLPYGEEIVGTIVLIDTFLGELLRISSTNYEGDGELEILHSSDEPDTDVYRLVLNHSISELSNKDSIMFKVGAKKAYEE